MILILVKGKKNKSSLLNFFFFFIFFSTRGWKTKKCDMYWLSLLLLWEKAVLCTLVLYAPHGTACLFFDDHPASSGISRKNCHSARRIKPVPMETIILEGKKVLLLQLGLSVRYTILFLVMEIDWLIDWLAEEQVSSRILKISRMSASNTHIHEKTIHTNSLNMYSCTDQACAYTLPINYYYYSIDHFLLSKPFVWFLLTERISST